MKTRLLICFTLFCLALGVERAEAVTITWNGSGANSNWSNGANWVGGVAPAAANDVSIPATANMPTVNVGQSCNSLTITGTTNITLSAVLTVKNGLIINNGATLTFLGSSNPKFTNGPLTINTGSLIFSGGITATIPGVAALTGTMASPSAITINTGNAITFSSALTIPVNCTLNCNSGSTLTLSINNATPLTNNGTVNITSAAFSETKLLSNREAIDNSGAFNWDSGNFAFISNGQSIINNSSGVFKITSTTSHSTFTLFNTCSIQNSGTMTANAASFTMSGNTSTINNEISTASFTSNSCTYTISGTTGSNITNSGSFIDHNSQFTFSGSGGNLQNIGGDMHTYGTTISFIPGSAQVLNNTANFTVDSVSTISLTSSNATITNSGSGVFNVTSSTLNLGAALTTGVNINNSAVSPAGFNISSSTITFTNSSQFITNSGYFTITNTSIPLAISDYITNSGTFKLIAPSLASGYSVYFPTTCYIANTGTFTANGYTFDLSANTTYINNSAAASSFTAQSCAFIFNAITTAYINNAGTFLDHGSTYTFTGNNKNYIENNGTNMHLSGSTLNFSASGASGFIINNPSSTLTADSATTITLASTKTTIRNSGNFYAGTSGSSCNISTSGTRDSIYNYGAGNFYLGPTSIITSSSTGTGANLSKVINASTGVFTLQSDVTGSATIGDLTSTTTTFTGAFTVQRYLSGGNSYDRGYRLLSSPVYTSVDMVNNIDDYSINYLKNNIVLTGTNASGGFDQTGNPTLYIYAEDFAPQYSTFLNSNFIGINNISTQPTYSLDTNLPGYSSTTIPVGTGYLCFFRGDRSATTLAAETTPGYTPVAVALNATGTLVTGQVYVRDWYSQTTGGAATPTLDSVRSGYTLVGNPYASTIDLSKYQKVSKTNGIYGSGIGNFVYELNPTSGSFGVYDLSGTLPSTNGAIQYIASGQGFFVVATHGAQLIFNESAKTSTLISPSSSILMARRVTTATLNSAVVNPTPSLHLQLFLDSIHNEDIGIIFNPKAKSQYVFNEDARYRLGNGLVNFSSLSSDKTALAINQLPLPNQTPETIQLHTGATNDGTYKLNMLAIQNLPGLYDVWLMDAYKKDSLDIKHNPTYTFDIIRSDASTFGSGRFTLVIRQNPALMVHLLNFGASKAVGGANIVWTTENEQNYTYFAVERSSDGGKTFNVVGSVAASAQGSYSLVDAAPPIAADMYRLKITDLNGTVSYSKVVTLMYANNGNTIAVNNLMVYPNPATGKVNLAIDETTGKAVYNIEIVNNTGSIIKTAQSSSPLWQTDVSTLAPGTYFISVVNAATSTIVGKSAFVKL